MTPAVTSGAHATPAEAGEVVIDVNTGSAPAASTDTSPAVLVDRNSNDVAEYGSVWMPSSWSSSVLPAGGATTVVSTVAPLGVPVAGSGFRTIRSPASSSSRLV